MWDRLAWRIQPIEHIQKRKQRKKDMWARHEAFAEYVERVKRKKDKNVCDNQNRAESK